MGLLGCALLNNAKVLMMQLLQFNQGAASVVQGTLERAVSVPVLCACQAIIEPACSFDSLHT